MCSSSDLGVKLVIPARYASTRLPGKPLVSLAGIPMVVRVFDQVSKVIPAENVVVAIDDERVEFELKKRSIPYMMTSSNHESGTDRIAEVARLLGWGEDEVIINVQGDEPLLPLDLLVAFKDFCISHPSLEISSVAVPFDGIESVADQNIVKVVLDHAKNALFFSRSPIPFCRGVDFSDWPYESLYRHVGIYGYRNSVLQILAESNSCLLESMEKLEQLRALWYGMKISMMPWHIAPPHGVDTVEDSVRIDRLLKGERQCL